MKNKSLKVALCMASSIALALPVFAQTGHQTTQNLPASILPLAEPTVAQEVVAAEVQAVAEICDPEGPNQLTLNLPSTIMMPPVCIDPPPDEPVQEEVVAEVVEDLGPNRLTNNLPSTILPALVEVYTIH